MTDKLRLLEDIGNEEIKYINEYGFARPGNNGPYKIQERPVRNSAHWICVFKYLYKKTNNEKYKRMIIKLGNYLISNEFNYKNGAVQCMEPNNKMDSINGTIGQAWIIEGLINAFLITRDERYYEKSVEIFNCQKYNKKIHLWERVDTTGKNLGIDVVFNHELWFAAAGAMIINAKENDKIHEEIEDFLKNIDKLYNVHKDGLFMHYIPGYERKEKITLKIIAKRLLVFLKCFDPKFDKYSFEAGYHLFDLYGFAIIYNNIQNNRFIKSEKFIKALKYGLDINKLNKHFNIKHSNSNFYKINKYAYPYNSPAFEYEYIDFTFNQSRNASEYDKLFNKQMELFYNKKEKKFSLNTYDGNTLTARIYELTKYLERMEEE